MIDRGSLLDRVISASNEPPEAQAEALAAYGLVPEETITEDTSAVSVTKPAEQPPADTKLEEGKADDTPPADTKADDDDDTPPEALKSDEKGKGRWAKRTELRNRLKAENAEQKSKIEALEKQLAEATKKPVDPKKPGSEPEPVKVELKEGDVPAFPEAAPVEPKLADFLETEDPQTMYLDARAEWRENMRDFKARKKEWESSKTAEVTKQKTDEQVAAKTQKQQADSRYERISAKLAETRQAHPDFDSKVKADNYTDAVLAVTMDPDHCDNGPEVLHYLAEHPDLLKSINDVTAGTQEQNGKKFASLEAFNRALREIAKIEARMTGETKADTPPPAAAPPAKEQEPPPAARISKPPSSLPASSASAQTGDIDWENAGLEELHRHKERRRA